MCSSALFPWATISGRWYAPATSFFRFSTSPMTVILKAHVTSALARGGATATPSGVLLLARQICTAVMGCLGRGAKSARLVPEGAGSLVVHICTPAGREIALQCVPGMSYAMWPDKIVDMLVAVGTITLPVPDTVEALHLIGIILDDLGATILDIGARTRERNGDVLARPLVQGESAGKMDRCDHFRNRVPCALYAPGDLQCAMSAGGTSTSLEMFNRACEVVTRSRFLKHGPVRAYVWGRRRTDKVASPAASAQAFAQQGEEVALRLVDSEDCSTITIFTTGAPLTTSEIMVPDLLCALHLAGMVIEGMGATIRTVGRRFHETNEEVLAHPLLPGRGHGQMVNASNFVAPLGLDALHG
jgi:hypothetical protein